MFKRLLIANRGEIAVRIARAAACLGIASVAAYSEDDVASPHVRAATAAAPLPGHGPRAYLDSAAVIAAASAAGCDALHPGYGFLSENAGFAADCAAAGIAFIGPGPAALILFGDKAAARAAAEAAVVPVLDGTGAVSLAEAKTAFARLGAVMIKAVAGGGGRGMRIVTRAADLPEAYARASSEAWAAFGDGRVYLEAYMPRARHIEVQLIGDQHGGLTHAGTRECSLQRRHQKLIEIAPAHLPAGTEAALLDAALRLGRAAHYDNLGTVEFLLDTDDTDKFAFIEMNPRLQVEHTVTEEVTGIDLVATQIRLAAGASLADLALPHGHRGVAVQARVNAERVSADGALRASHAVITRYEAPSGPGIRVDGFARAGTQPNPAFDSLLAKVIARGANLCSTLALLDRALGEFTVDGPATNIGFLRALIAHPDVMGDRMTTSLVDAITADLVATLPTPEAAAAQVVPEGLVGVPAPLSGLVVAVTVVVGDTVRIGAPVAVLEAMKMEHVVTAQVSGIVRRIDAQVGTVANDGDALVLVEPSEVEAGSAIIAAASDLDHIRDDLADVLTRNAATRDEQRPDAVARRRKTGQRTARENIAELIDPGSFNEYGALTFAAQLKRHPREHLLKISPADGLIAGTASVNGDTFGPEKSRVMVLSYDYTVFAGTQGTANHKKTDRMLNLARDWALPLIWYAEGGGGRPGDTDHFSATGLDVPSFRALAALSGTCLRIGITSGRCFAGNAVMFGLCDITIATRDSTIGLGGPAMIEGGGLGKFKPEEVGPIGVMSANGVVDIVAENEPHATAMAKQLLSYFQGDLPDPQAADQRLLRHSIPENRLRVYDVRSVIDTLFDSGSGLELRRGWGIGLLTGFARLGGRAIGYMANDPKHLGGAIDSDGASKAAHFMMLCDAFGIPIISLCDTPGFMVGPPSEVTAAVRHGSRMFTVGASLSVPVLMVVLRKGYGLGAQAMGAGSLHAPALTIAWPTAEFGGMGLEGAVRLGYAKELAACATEDARQALFDELVAKSYKRGKAVSIAAYLEIDAVIDPADTRDWLLRVLAALPRVAPSGRMVDNW